MSAAGSVPGSHLLNQCSQPTLSAFPDPEIPPLFHIRLQAPSASPDTQNGLFFSLSTPTSCVGRLGRPLQSSGIYLRAIFLSSFRMFALQSEGQTASFSPALTLGSPFWLPSNWDTFPKNLKENCSRERFTLLDPSRSSQARKSQAPPPSVVI